MYAINNDPLQCNYIKQRINAIQVLPNELQEIDLKKKEFSETVVAKMSKEPQPPLGGMFGKEHFGNLAYIEDQIEEEIYVREESQANKFPILMRNLACMILLISFMP